MRRIVPLHGSWEPRLHAIRHPEVQRDFYGVLLEWTRSYLPEVHRLFLVEDVGTPREDWGTIAVHAPWLQDPVQQWSEPTYAWAERVERACDDMGIPVINRVTRLINATKCRAARLMAAAGVRVPRMERIQSHEAFRDSLLGIEPPLFVREDWGHAGPMIRANTVEEARAIDLDQFDRPVATELIEVGGADDGLYRKYRYVAALDRGIPHHLQITDHWLTRGGDRLLTEQTKGEELEYIARPDPNHETLQRARRALGFEFVAFDYGYDRGGNMIVWEANPFPLIQFSMKKYTYRNDALHRTIIAMICMYLDVAAIPYPSVLRNEVARWDA